MGKALRTNLVSLNNQIGFEDARGFFNIEKGLRKVGFSEEETNGILGNNWYNFYRNI